MGLRDLTPRNVMNSRNVWNCKKHEGGDFGCFSREDLHHNILLVSPWFSLGAIILVFLHNLLDKAYRVVREKLAALSVLNC